MQEHDILEKILGIARKKKTFMLSDIISRDMGDQEKTVGEALRRLPGLGFKVTKAENDYLISRTREIKKPDGRFILTPEEEFRLDKFLARPSVPKILDDLTLQYISKKTTKAWDDPVILEKIRNSIMDQKREYWKEGEKKRVHYRQGYSIFAYLAYQFPVYFIETLHLLRGLASSGLLKEKMTILDAGSGPGVGALAITEFLSRAGHGSATIHAVEISEEQREAYTFLTNEYAVGDGRIEIKTPISADLRLIEKDKLPTGVDLILFQNVLNEMSSLTTPERAALVKKLSGVLTPDGIIVISEPADLVNATELRKQVQTLSKSGIVSIAPCPDAWLKRCDAGRCWTFVEKNPLNPTLLMKAVASGPEAYRFLNTDIKYSYAILGLSTRSFKKHDNPGCSKSAQFSMLERHIDKRINVCASVMSADLGNQKTHLWKLCDGTPQKPVYAVMPDYHRSHENSYILESAYGEQIALSGVLARYNPGYDSYNLLVTRATRISPLSPERPGFKKRGTEVRKGR